MTEKIKTNYKNMAVRYQMAERLVWSKLSDWKKRVVSDCKLSNTHDDRIFSEYVKEIISFAECETTQFDDTLPEVPETPKAVKIPDPQIT